ncbi:right-handed parallel beta-helix repeat-containing protein [Pseudomonadota bacterium]
MKVKYNLPIMIVLSAAVLLPMGANARVSVSDLQLSDGVILIDQAKAMAGNVTPGDAAGFPVTIGQSGSYRLASNLTVADGTKDGIEITTNNVTVDLNGFSISGSGNGIGRGIVGPSSITVENGVVRDMGGHGIELDSQARVQKVRSFGNGGHGISVTSAGILNDNSAADNAGNGIRIGVTSVVIGNAANVNGGNGIEEVVAFQSPPAQGGGSLVKNNTVGRNTGNGIVVGGSSMVKDNTANSNDMNGIVVFDFNDDPLVAGCLVVSNTANLNNSDGINTQAGCSVKNNTANGNNDDGIDVHAASLVLDNMTRDNINFGLRLGIRVGYGHNVVTDNNGGLAFPQVFGGIEIDTNLCGTDTICP